MTEQMRVLIVDDEKMNRDLLVALLKPLYRVMVAKSGEQALKAASRVMGKPDIILLDIMMPDMDGYEVCRRLKANEESMNIPVIFVTAMGEVEDESKGFSLGAVDYIIKPVSLPIVQARVNTHLRLKHKTDLLERMAFLDGLTEIPNRRAFDTALHKEWNRAKRAAIPLAMIMMDVDKVQRPLWPYRR
jgi:PleD family two-component response regulator